LRQGAEGRIRTPASAARKRRPPRGWWASELCEDGSEVHFFLVRRSETSRVGKERAVYRWLLQEEMQRSEELMEAVEYMPNWWRGSDPSGRGWVVSVLDSQPEPGLGQVYKVKWFTWERGVACRFKHEWRPLDVMVDKGLAASFDAKRAAQAT